MLENPIAVSVIVPVYNTEEYLRECLESIINQTLKNIEILLVNDGSTDGSLAILKEYGQKDNRITVFDEPNTGAGAARNIGLESARGEYLSFLDSDDFFEPNMLELAYKKAKEEHADVIGFKRITYNNQTKKTETVSGSLDTLNNWDKLVRRKFLEEFNIKFQNIKINNDNFFALAVRYASKKSVFMDNVLVYHRININNISSTRYKYSKCAVEAAKKIKEFLIENNLYESHKQSFYTRFLENLVYEGTNCLTKNPDKQYFNEYIEEVLDFLPKEYHQIFFDHLIGRYNNLPKIKREEISPRLLLAAQHYYSFFGSCHFEFKREFFHYYNTPYKKELCFAGIRVFQRIKNETTYKISLFGIQIYKIWQETSENTFKKRIRFFGIPVYSQKKTGGTSLRRILFFRSSKTD